MKRSAIAAAAGCMIAVGAWAGAAWACTAVASVDVEGRSGAPGSKQVVKGLAFGDGEVELRWNAPDGALLAKATGPAFSVPVTIPESAPGVYYLVGVQRDAGGKVWKAPASFEVLAPGDVAAQPSSVNAGAGLAASSAADRGTSPLALGVGLLVAGAVVLVAGITVVQVRVRRRAPAVVDAR